MGTVLSATPPTKPEGLEEGVQGNGHPNHFISGVQELRVHVPPLCRHRDKGGGDAACLLQVWGKWGKKKTLPHLQEKQVEGDWGGTCLHPQPHGDPLSWWARAVPDTMTQQGYECQPWQPHIWKGFCRKRWIKP